MTAGPELEQLGLVLQPLAHQLQSFHLASDWIAERPHQFPTSLAALLPLMTSLRYLCLTGILPAPVSRLGALPHLQRLILTWGYQRARDGEEWRWDDLTDALKFGNGVRLLHLDVEIRVSGVLRAYDIAQRASKGAFEGSDVEGVTVMLSYWEGQPFCVFSAKVVRESKSSKLQAL